MKILLILLMFTQVPVSAQHNIKKVLVEGEGIPIVMLAGGTADMSGFALPSKELSGNYKVIRMEHFNVQYCNRRVIPSKELFGRHGKRSNKV